MKSVWYGIMTTLLLASSSFAAMVNVTTIEQLDQLAKDNGGFSFSAFGDNNGYAKSNYTSGDNNAKGMARLEDWVKANDKFILGVGDHAIGTRKNWYQMNEKDAFFHNHYYPSLGDNCNGTDYFYGSTGDQAVWGRGWVMFKALNNFFTRKTAIDEVTFRPKGTAKVYSSKSKSEPNVLVPYDDQLCDYYAKRTQGKFTFHIISVNVPDPGVLASVSKNFMINKLNSLAATKTDYDVIVVMAQKASWVKRAEDSKWLTRAERDTIMTVADLVLCGDDHIYRRQSEFDGQYDGTEAIYMNIGQPCASTGSGRGYLNFHMFDNPPRFTVQYIMNEVESTRKLHVTARQIGSLQKSLPAAHTKPYLKFINGKFESVNWASFVINASNPPVTLTNNASYVSQSVPSSIDVGASANVTVRMKNSGTKPWSGDYYIGSQNPQDNTTWGMNRVKLPAGVTVAAGAEYSFSFAITAPATAGTYNFQWKMIDASAPDWFGASSANQAITVNAIVVNQPPTFPVSPFSMPDATEGVAYSQSISGKATDPEGGTKTFSKVSGPAWLSVSAAGIVSGTPGSVDVGVNSFSVKVTDNGGLTDTATMTIRVIATTTTVPWVTNMTEAAAGTAITNAGLTVSSVSLEYNAMTAGRVFSQTPGGNNSALIGSSVALAVSKGPSNQPPYFPVSPFSIPDATVGIAYSQSIVSKAVDPEGAAMVFSKLSGPAWLSLSASGVVTGTPGSADVGTNSVTVRVTDAAGATITGTMTVVVKSAITIPVVSFIAPTNLTVQAGGSLYVNVGATDPEGIDRVRLYKDGVELARSEGGAPYEWGATNQVDPELQNLSAGSFVLTAKATDKVGSVGEKSVTVTVVAGLPSVGSIITLKAVNGKYVSATYSTNNTLIANKTNNLTNYERFKVVNATNSIALQCMGNNQFVSIATPSGSKPMLANRPTIGSYEKFTLEQSGSSLAIRSVLSNKYVSAISNGAAPLQANQTYIGAYEKFTWKVE